MCDTLDTASTGSDARRLVQRQDSANATSSRLQQAVAMQWTQQLQSEVQAHGSGLVEHEFIRAVVDHSAEVLSVPKLLQSARVVETPVGFGNMMGRIHLPGAAAVHIQLDGGWLRMPSSTGRRLRLRCQGQADDQYLSHFMEFFAQPTTHLSDAHLHSSHGYADLIIPGSTVW